MDNFQRHVDFGLSVCESVSSFGKKNLIGNNFWSTRHRDFIFGMNNMTPFKWKVQTKVNEYMYDLGFYFDT